MKRLLSVFVIAASLMACNENGATVEGQVDSLNNKLENVGEKIEEKAEQAWDSTKQKASEIKDKAEQKWDSAKDRNKYIDTINKQ